MRKYNKESFINSDLDKFKTFAKKSKQSLTQLTSIIESELAAYDHNSGLYRTVVWSVRKKETRRICEKLSRIKKGNINSDGHYKLDKLIKQHGKNEFYLRDLIHDLVGARIVVYFSEQLKFTLRYVLTWPFFDVKRITAYEDKENKWIPDSVRTMLQGISEKHGHTLVIEKQANNPSYESIHIHLSINPNFSKRIKNYLHIKQVNINDLSKYTVEIQIRTLLQHAWSQNEHNLNYSINKSRRDKHLNLSMSTDNASKHNYEEILKEDFAQLKTNLSAAESMQSLIWNRYIRNHQAISSENESLDFGDRLSVFGKTEERTRVEEAQHKMLSAINSPIQMRSALQRLKELAIELSEKYGGPKILSAEKPDDLYNWARQRAFLLAIGYAAIRSNSDTGIVINDFFRENLHDLISSNVLDNTARLYAYIRLWDNEKKDELIDGNNGQDELLLIDPIVSYRQAFVEYSANNPKYALRLIENSIRDRKKLIKGKKGDRSSSLNLKHLYRRKAQCYWAMYLLFADGTDDNLDSAEYEYKQSFKERKDTPRSCDNKKKENIKLAALYGVLLFHRYIYGGKWTQFDPIYFSKQYTKYISQQIVDMEKCAVKKEDTKGLLTHVIALYQWKNGGLENSLKNIMNQSFSPELDPESSILKDIRNVMSKYESLEQFTLSEII